MKYSCSNISFLATVFLLVFIVAVSVHSQYRCERIGSDYSGSVLTAAGIFLYGNNGVIIKSSDKGQSWTRFTIPGPNLLITNVICRDSLLFASSANGSVYESDIFAKAWIKSSLSTLDSIIGMCIDSRTKDIIIVGKTSYNVYDMNGLKTTISRNGPSAYNNVFVIHDAIYASTTDTLFRLNSNPAYIPKSIDVHSWLSCKSCLKPSKVCNYGDRSVVLWNSVWYLVNSDLTEMFPTGENFSAAIFSDSTLITMTDSYDANRDLGNLTLDQYSVASNLLTKISSKLLDDEYYIGFSAINNIARYDDSTLIAYGAYSTVYVSTDAGARWYLKSYREESVTPVMYDSLFGVYSGRIRITTTRDGNITWLPQSIKSDLVDHGWLTGGLLHIVNDSVIVNVCDHNLFGGRADERFSTDGGVTFAYDSVPQLQWGPYVLHSESVIRRDDGFTILRSMSGIQQDTFKYYYTTAVKYNASARVVDYKLVDSVSFSNIVKGDGVLYTLATDYHHFTGYKSQKIYKSINGGEDWNEIERKVNRIQYLQGISLYNNVLFVASSAVVNNVAYSYLDYYDLSDAVISGRCFADTVTFNYPVLNWNHRLNVGGRSVMRYWDAGSSSLAEWKSDSTLGDYTYTLYDLCGGAMTAFLGIKNNEGKVRYNYPVLIYKDDNVTEVVYKNTIESAISVYLGNVSPNPCVSNSHCILYHDERSLIGSANIALYDYYGQQVTKSSYTVRVTNIDPSKDKIDLELKNVAAGTYVLKARVAGEDYIRTFIKY